MNLGDEIDQHALGKWTSDPDGYSAGHEHSLSLLMLEEYWDLFPKQDICISNHTWRIFKTAMNAGIPKAFLRDIKDFMNAPKGTQWQQRYIIDDIVFEHGENVSGVNAAFNAAMQNGMSTVIGHQHNFAGVKFTQRASGVLFGMNVGCLIDLDQYAFNYTKTSRLKPMLGCGVIIEGMPYFIPMVLDENNKWIGRLLF